MRARERGLFSRDGSRCDKERSSRVKRGQKKKIFQGTGGGGVVVFGVSIVSLDSH